ncbi:MAG: hypothetical protein HQM16_14790 [Deltaproteobacteria bacterium]|nr:hypothetical protein [Deltaproteobacteria bacterium]
MNTYPKNGLLSGMALVYLTAFVILVSGSIFPFFNTWFTGYPMPELVNAFLVSIILMAAHKGESYYFKEYDRCPVYLAAGDHAGWMREPRRVLFVGFVGTFLVFMVVINLILRGPPWPFLLLGIWMVQGWHEIHHSAKTLVERRYYPGVVTSVLFVLHIDVFVFPKWLFQIFGYGHFIGYVYYAVQPLIFLAFVFEHKRWVRQIKEMTGVALA